jgi:hypothetical protein
MWIAERTHADGSCTYLEIGQTVDDARRWIKRNAASYKAEDPSILVKE